QHLDRATNNNIEQQSIDYVVNTLRPWIKRHEQEYNRKLFTANDKEQGYFVRFNMEGLLRGDSKSRSEYYSKMFNIGAMSQNEIRNLEKMNPIEGGDTHYTPVNLVDDEGRVTQNTNTDEE
ncbi:MAG TPA: phage portal protein, partial [Candidatus Paceibacterota bacterium]|nr:phage portal protein [Candidatus Paceibacterota bacterium]